MAARLLPLLAFAGLSAGGAAALACSPAQLNHSLGVTDAEVLVGGRRRRFVLYVPAYYALGAPLPLWLLAPGAFNEPEKQMAMSEMVAYAEQQQFAFAAIDGEANLMNVVLRGQAVPGKPDDVAYTAAVLDAVQRELCVDARRIFCTGYSRGARFCSRLASELSGRIAAIATVSGLRFPEPANATRPVPILAFHGTRDPVNPYGGHGNPEYWDDSVPEAVSKWVEFNGCRAEQAYRQSPSVLVTRHTECNEGADVVFVKIDGGGHTWPGSRFPWKGLGNVTYEINASSMMGAFFLEHPLDMEQVASADGDSLMPALVLMTLIAAVSAAGLAVAFCRGGFRAGSETDSDDSSTSQSDLEKSS